MKKTVNLKGKTIEYTLQYKNVKNINIRIKPCGEIHVSANKKVSQKFIEEFIILKADFILKALERYENTKKQSQQQYFTEEEIKEVIHFLCKKVYPYFENKGIKYPQIKFRKMVSRWGSCNFIKGILTFNINLMYAPVECIEYVVLHEFTHFLQDNHSNKFYEELERVCPKWKECRRKLKDIYIY